MALAGRIIPDSVGHVTANVAEHTLLCARLVGIATLTKLAFVCIGNAGRSQMAVALAERERAEQGMDGEIITDGVDSVQSVYDEVVEAMQEADIDISDRTA